MKFDKFVKNGQPVHITHIQCAYRSGFRSRRTRHVQVALRAIKEANGWRVDKSEVVAGGWMPWEPVDNHPYKRLSEAKKVLRAYGKACKRPRTT